MLDFRNLNTLWASVLVETLYRCGLETAIICPGSRSAPLTVAFAQHPAVEAIPVLDERSASFFALGIAQRTHKPVVLVCTSGTAGANFYPAVIEAKESRVPLIVLTADRPPELRDCNAGQAIDQQKLFGDFPNYYAELAIPETDLLDYLRQKVAQAFQQAIAPVAGAVHLNIPLRDPLAPVIAEDIQASSKSFPEDFFQHLSIQSPAIDQSFPIPSEWHDRKGIIIAGVAAPKHPELYCTAIAQLSQTLGYSVLAEGLSPVRNFASFQPHLITTYDSILRNHDRAAKLAPEIVIRIGAMPISKILRSWLTQVNPEIWIIDETPRSIDPIHGRTQQIYATIEDLKVPLMKGDLGGSPTTEPINQTGATQNPTSIAPDLIPPNSFRGAVPTQGGEASYYLNLWQTAESKLRTHIDQIFTATTNILESKVAWLLPQVLPPNTPIFIANSMPVRDVEYFWPGNDRHIQPFFNRGANGIDGTLSTALGVAHQGKPTVLLTGDLALLHDTNGFLMRKYLRGSLTIVVINNNGGGIFGMLPIAQFEPPFEEFFSTPQNVDFADLCKTYGINHCVINDWETFCHQLEALPKQDIQVLEVRCDRTVDVTWRKQFQENVAAGV
ncbi:2-succinyl-5-enolpyruvyl-6-hydroxy-3-cyclohexene-1-carboxylic-acid synthase [filamentous cyanobacterium LEGE 11480]|uniref:2-succinyl-5-enolpyruvyl-6-hydroxy-3-cyclohexene-1-carboxylate synthase n=1 Tax=Romeriopsis navalis LEGE 11480 TaxID=2777977 RepID=A0A928Z2D7_9CYAN|nr:2-succinyl-5-enolpyruvyl-6-hydroxy-3-cyclohexene-1-carboxylic-acid synthase [Romeriopsis navalis]MBE9029434.1 2-succinyl-5-enolpyruvyl-6-hydroxy-3-cyclohexene-1-carboxylic-acid synthase [Romeriopsis navalis LEGE 11480]